LLFAFIVSGSVGLAVYLWKDFLRGWEVLDAHYAVEEVADMIAVFAMQHKGRPPENWAELVTVFEIVDRGYGRGQVGELEKRVQVDFATLQVISRAGFRHTDMPLVVTPREPAHVRTDVIRQINKRLIVDLRRLAQSENQQDHRDNNG